MILSFKFYSSVISSNKFHTQHNFIGINYVALRPANHDITGVFHKIYRGHFNFSVAIGRFDVNQKAMMASLLSNNGQVALLNA